jgi:muramoyltetrapeptide carboxypeptidase
MIKPPYLKKGDIVSIVAPARWMTAEEIAPSVELLESWGLKVKVGARVFTQYNQLAGSDEERASDFNSMLNDQSIKAILCARGGYGTLRIIEKLDFSKFLQSPKWIIGYSDITVLHSFINEVLQIETLHAEMPVTFFKNGREVNLSLQSLKDTLFGQMKEYIIPSHQMNRQGKANAILCGGNLSVLYSLRGTKMDIDTAGKILFIEDLDEYLYHIDRMMMNFKIGGKLENLKALIVGGMNDMHDNTVPFGKDAYEIIMDAVSEYNYPVIFEFPAGHIPDNRAIIMGGVVDINANKDQTVIKF